MADYMNQNAPPDTDSILQEIRNAVVDIADKVQKIQESIECNEVEIDLNKKKEYRAAEDVTLNKNVTLRLLGISQSTLAKWRYKSLLRFYPRNRRDIVYKYHDLMEALRAGRLVSRDFDPFAAIRRLEQWYEENIYNNSHGNENKRCKGRNS